MIKEQFQLSDKVALVVGGRGFLGGRLSDALAEFGARVYAADLPGVSRTAEKKRPSLLPGNVVQRHVDVTDPSSVERLVDSIVKETSLIDVLIYSVTAKPKDFYMPFTECSLEGWQTLMRAELEGLFLVTQRVGRIMETSGRGSIIFLASIYGIVGNDQRIYEGSNLEEVYVGANEKRPSRIYSYAGYAAAKGAIISLTRFLAAYWGGRGIRVNCVSPGGISYPGENEIFVRRYSERVPFRRKAKADEISGAVVYLASDASAYVTGHNLVVDGGWTAW